MLIFIFILKKLPLTRSRAFVNFLIANGVNIARFWAFVAVSKVILGSASIVRLAGRFPHATLLHAALPTVSETKHLRYVTFYDESGDLLRLLAEQAAFDVAITSAVLGFAIKFSLISTALTFWLAATVVRTSRFLRSTTYLLHFTNLIELQTG